MADTGGLGHAGAGDQPRRVLFLCTGNYYRSRYAEILLTERPVAGWVADSAGLRIDVEQKWNKGPLSARLDVRLAAVGIDRGRYERMPRPVVLADFESSALVIALDDAEHRPMMEEHWSAWSERVRYWVVPDVVPEDERDPLGRIERAVGELRAELLSKGGAQVALDAASAMSSMTGRSTPPASGSLA